MWTRGVGNTTTEGTWVEGLKKRRRKSGRERDGIRKNGGSEKKCDSAIESLKIKENMKGIEKDKESKYVKINATYFSIYRVCEKREKKKEYNRQTNERTNIMKRKTMYYENGEIMTNKTHNKTNKY